MAGKQMEAIIALAGRLDPSLAAAVKNAQSMINRFDKKAQKSKAIAAIGKTAKAVAVGLGAAAVAGGVFVGKSVQKGMEFDAAMSQVAATLGTTTDKIGNLRKFALEMGSTTAFTATQSAEALNYMALAGYDAETSMKMLPNVLNLAAAGNLELSEASDMVTDAQSALGLSIEQTNTLVDQMAKTASKTNTSVGQLGEAILTVGGTAQYMAGGTAGVNAALGVLADNGIKASEGGTHLRNILLKLANPTSEATALLEKMGVQAFDTQGKLKDFSELFPELNKAMSSMTDEERLKAMSTLFNARDIASATALLGTTKERWDEIGSALKNCDGAAKAMAATQLDNLAGDVTLFKSALEGAQITLSDALTPAMREFVQFGTRSITELQNAFNEGGLSGVISALVGIISQMLNALVSALPQIAQAAFQLVAELAMAIVQALPQVLQAAVQIVMMLAQGLTQAAPQLISAIFQAVGMMLMTLAQAAPQFAVAALQLIGSLAQGIVANLPMLISCGLQAIVQFILGIIQALPQIISIGIQLVTNLINGLVQALPQIIMAGVQAIMMLVQGILQNLPMLITAGIQAVVMLAQGLLSNLGAIIEAGVTLVVELGKAILTHLPEIAMQIGQGLIDGIGSAITGGIDAIGGFFSGLFGGGETEAASAAVDIGGSFDIVPMQIQGSLGQIGPIASGAAADASAAFQGVGDSMTTTFDQIPTTFQTSMDSTLTSAQTTATQLGTSFDQTGQQIQQALGAETVSGIQEQWTGLQSFFTTLASEIGNSFDSVGNSIQQSLSSQVEQIQAQWTGLQTFFTTLASTISMSFSTVGISIMASFTGIVMAIQAQFVGLQVFFMGLAMSISMAFVGVGASIIASFAGVSAAIVATFAGVAAAIMGTFAGLTGFFAAIAASITATYAALGASLAVPFQTAATAIMAIWSGVVSFFVSAWAQISAAFTAGAAAAAASASRITGSLSGISSMLYGIVSAANAAASALQSMASAAASAGAAASIAKAAGAGTFATGGVSNGLGIVGEDPRYPHEVVITPNPAYRTQNIGYLNTAARMLGVSGFEEKANPGPWDRAISAMGSSGIVADVNVESNVSIGDINFTPNINISGNASKDDVIAALRKVMPEFQEVVMEALKDGGVGDYTYEI